MVHAVLPAGVGDPDQPSGGNTYDRRVCDGLAAAGWDVREHQVPGNWPHPDPAALALLTEVVAAAPDGEIVLVDGLIASAAASTLIPAARRLRLVVLMHMPLGANDRAARGGERAVLAGAAAIVATSGWTRDRLFEWYDLDPRLIHVACPGVDPAGPARATADGRRLLCVAAVAPHKGHDVLIAALAELGELPWHCRLVGPLDRDPAFVAQLRAATATAGLDERVDFTGPLAGVELDHAYASADLLVLPSRGETYGMVVAEALAHGVPALVSDVGGVREALGDTGAGLLVPPGDRGALAAALRRWLTDADLRADQRVAAAARRPTVPGWADTVAQVAAALTAAAATPGH